MPVICKRTPASLLGILTLCLLLSGAACVKRSTQETESHPEEQLYFDAKLGFTLLHPLSWERLRVPVSSPEFRENSVNWKIPTVGGSGRMQVLAYPALANSADLPTLLEQFLAGSPEFSREEPEELQLAGGEALAITVRRPTYSQRLFAIHGARRAYLLSFQGSTDNFAEQLPRFNRIAESFHEN